MHPVGAGLVVVGGTKICSAKIRAFWRLFLATADGLEHLYYGWNKLQCSGIDSTVRPHRTRCNEPWTSSVLFGELVGIH